MNHDRIQRALSECVKLLQDPERARAAASLLRYNNSEELKEDLNSLRNNLDNVCSLLTLIRWNSQSQNLTLILTRTLNFPN